MKSKAGSGSGSGSVNKPGGYHSQRGGSRNRGSQHGGRAGAEKRGTEKRAFLDREREQFVVDQSCGDRSERGERSNAFEAFNIETSSRNFGVAPSTNTNFGVAVVPDYIRRTQGYDSTSTRTPTLLHVHNHNNTNFNFDNVMSSKSKRTKNRGEPFSLTATDHDHGPLLGNAVTSSSASYMPYGSYSGQGYDDDGHKTNPVMLMPTSGGIGTGEGADIFNDPDETRPRSPFAYQSPGSSFQVLQIDLAALNAMPYGSGSPRRVVVSNIFGPRGKRGEGEHDDHDSRRSNANNSWDFGADDEYSDEYSAGEDYTEEQEQLLRTNQKQAALTTRSSKNAGAEQEQDLDEQKGDLHEGKPRKKGKLGPYSCRARALDLSIQVCKCMLWSFSFIKFFECCANLLLLCTCCVNTSSKRNPTTGALPYYRGFFAFISPCLGLKARQEREDVEGQFLAQQQPAHFATAFAFFTERHHVKIGFAVALCLVMSTSLLGIGFRRTVGFRWGPWLYCTASASQVGYLVLMLLWKNDSTSGSASALTASGTSSYNMVNYNTLSLVDKWVVPGLIFVTMWVHAGLLILRSKRGGHGDFSSKLEELEDLDYPTAAMAEGSSSGDANSEDSYDERAIYKNNPRDPGVGAACSDVTPLLGGNPNRSTASGGGRLVAQLGEGEAAGAMPASSRTSNVSSSMIPLTRENLSAFTLMTRN
ncbi:unnamed protein product [Amoebophrya sp. A25]|nr:unnamed protein product [Amoebophrya sp. A25]|eukprot:GSA25T00003281001.1